MESPTHKKIFTLELIVNFFKRRLNELLNSFKTTVTFIVIVLSKQVQHFAIPKLAAYPSIRVSKKNTKNICGIQMRYIWMVSNKY